MRRWAWVWLACLALLGWAPALVVSYFVALAVAVGFRVPGRLAFGGAYALLLAAGLVLMVQVGNHTAVTGKAPASYVWIGGLALIALWSLAFVLSGGLVIFLA